MKLGRIDPRGAGVPPACISRTRPSSPCGFVLPRSAFVRLPCRPVIGGMLMGRNSCCPILQNAAGGGRLSGNAARGGSGARLSEGGNPVAKPPVAGRGAKWARATAGCRRYREYGESCVFLALPGSGQGLRCTLLDPSTEYGSVRKPTFGGRIPTRPCFPGPDPPARPATRRR